MLLPIAVFAATVGSLGVVVYNLRKAPEAYEDEHGLHILRKRAPGSAGMRSAKQQTLRRLESLKQADAKL